MTGAGQEIHVEAYSGHKAPEKPRVVHINRKKYTVQRIENSWRESRFDDGEIEEHFEVTIENYGDCEIVYNHQWDRWTLKPVR